MEVAGGLGVATGATGTGNLAGGGPNGGSVAPGGAAAGGAGAAGGGSNGAGPNGRGNGGGGGVSPQDAAAAARLAKIQNTNEKLDEEEYRDLLISLTPEGPEKDNVDDELRAADGTAGMHSVLVKKIKRDALLDMVIKGGAALSDYEKTRATRSTLLQHLQSARLV